jgi:hypothetical protein
MKGGAMGRKRAEGLWVDGTWWERSEWERAQSLAVAISGADVQLIDKLVRHVEDAHRRGRPDISTGRMFSEQARWQRLVRDLYERAGAADAAQENPQGVPLTVAEIKQVEEIRHKIYYYSGYYTFGGRDPRVNEADDLLNKLHFLVGRAKATGSAGGVTVFQAEPGRAQLPAAE